MRMSDQQKDNLTLTYRAIAIGLLTWIGTDLQAIKHEIRASSDFKIEQQGINREVDKAISRITNYNERIDLDVKKLAERQFLFEATCKEFHKINDN